MIIIMKYIELPSIEVLKQNKERKLKSVENWIKIIRRNEEEKFYWILWLIQYDSVYTFIIYPVFFARFPSVLKMT